MDQTSENTAKPSSFRKKEFIISIIGIISLISGFTIGMADNPPGIALVLLGAFTLLYSILSNFGKTKSLGPLLRFIYWAPRTLCIITTVFISIFALDVFQPNQRIWNNLIALFMHLIPTFVMIAILVLSWRWEWIGGALYTLVGLLYIAAAWGRFPIPTYFIISGPLLLTGILFLTSWKNRDKFRIKD